jgi:RNA polymerase sigma-70 factor (ECF subfamily)
MPAIDIAELLQSGYRYALSLTREKSSAEDLLQEAWLAKLKAKGPTNKPYLFTAIRSRYINMYRRDQLVSIVALNEFAELGDPLFEQEQLAIENDHDYAELEAALATLRPVERETLYLMAVEGYTAQEVADLTSQPRNTVLSLNYRARQKARRYYQRNQIEVSL